MKKYIVVSALLTAALSCSGGGGGGGGGGQPEYPYLCTNGTPAGGGSSTENEQRCSACNTDYRLVDAACRKEYPYVCTNGTAVAEKSLNENEQRCSACNMGWDFNPDTQVCDGNSYACLNGLPKEGMPPSDGDIACISCNTGWRPEDTDFDGENECLENHYTCPNGTPLSDDDNRPAVHEAVHCASCDTDEGYKRTTLDPPDCKRLEAVYVWVTADSKNGSFEGAGRSGADALCGSEFGTAIDQGSGLTLPGGYPVEHRAVLADSTELPSSWVLVGNSTHFASLKVKKPSAADATLVNTWQDLFRDGTTLSSSHIPINAPTGNVLTWTGLKDGGTGVLFAVADVNCVNWTHDQTYLDADAMTPSFGASGELYTTSHPTLADDVPRIWVGGADQYCSNPHHVVCVTY